MKSLLHDHPSQDVRRAAIALADALTQWERSTGRDYLVIVKEAGGYQWRSFTGGDVSDTIADVMLLANFETLMPRETK